MVLTATGDSLTASDLNSSFTTVGQTNMTFACLDDYSANAAEMNTTTDPNSTGSASLATTGAGELERLRHVLQHAFGFSNWWRHYQDINVGHRQIRSHFTVLTGYKELIRSEAHLASSTTRFHLFSLSVADYTPGAAHPESALALFHVGGSTRFMVSIGGDVHVGSTLALHAAGSLGNAALYRHADASTGLYFPAGGHVGVTAAGVELARFHGYGMVLAPHAAVSFRSAGGAGATHVTALSLSAGNAVTLGDPNRSLTLHASGLTVGGDRLVGYNAAGTGLEAKAISGTGITITHQAGGLALSVLAGPPAWGSRGQFSGTGGAANADDVFTLRAHAVVLISAATHASVLRVGPADINVTITTSGPAANGRDRATALSASSWVHFYWIWNGTTLAGTASPDTPLAGPNLPAGYTHWSYAGAIRLNATSDLVATHIMGSMAYYSARQSALTDGAATAETTVDLATLVPPNAVSTLLSAKLAVTAPSDTNANETATIRAVAGSDFHLLQVWPTNANSDADAESAQVVVPNISQRIFYLTTNSTNGTTQFSLWVNAYALPNGG